MGVIGTRHPLDKRDVRDFAARELGATIGLDLPGRCFLAGGVFKTLVHGREPRDLDVWCPSPADRGAVVRRLLDRGAVRVDRARFADAFVVAGRVVEVPNRTDRSSLAELLARFDIALSAVAVELDRGTLRPMVHPLARTSVERREVLLLKPLANWKHCLGTLSRARRYAADLGWSLSAEEEAAVWSVFDAAHPAMQLGMVARYEKTALPGWGVLEEARCRLRR